MKRWPLHKAYFWETAPFFRILLPFAAGILAYDKGWLPSSQGNVFIAITCTTLVAYMLSTFTIKNNIIPFVLLHVSLFCCGASVSFFNDIRNTNEWFGNNIKHNTSFYARITDTPLEKERTWRISVTLVASLKNDTVSPATGNAVVYLLKKDSVCRLHKGDSVLLPGNWQLIRNAGNPFEFDYATYCRRNNLFYRQVCSENQLHRYAPADSRATPIVERTHDWCMATLDKYIPEPKTRGLIQAMLLGDEVNLDEDLRRSYSETGIVHIIAISGGNVAIFFIFISALLFWLRNKKHLWVKYLVALPLVWFYVVMAGAPPSAIRAALMFSLLAFAMMLQKNSNSLNQLFAAAFLLLCAQPMWLFSVGFQLSFVAVLSLVLFYTPVYKWISPVYKVSRWLWGAIAASVAAEILVAPLVIYYFHIFPLLFLVANVAAYVFMSIVLLIGIIIILASPVPAIAGAAGFVTVWLVTRFDNIVAWLQALNPRSFHFLVLTTAELLLLYLIVAAMAVFFLQRQTRAAFIGLSAASLLLLSFCVDEWIRLQQQRLIIYNTGKTAHIELIRADTYAILKTDTAEAGKIAYAVMPAHIGWRAWKQDSTKANEIFYVGGKKVLFLNDDIKTNSHFRVDYLVVNTGAARDLHRLCNIFYPNTIVIGNNKAGVKWIRMPAADSVLVHSVKDDGAFVVY
jgi:competence protein ComEC